MFAQRTGVAIRAVAIGDGAHHDPLFVDVHVFFAVGGVGEAFFALGLETGKRFFSGVHAHVDFEVLAPGKSLPTTRGLADEWFFSLTIF